MRKVNLTLAVLLTATLGAPLALAQGTTGAAGTGMQSGTAAGAVSGSGTSSTSMSSGTGAGAVSGSGTVETPTDKRHDRGTSRSGPVEQPGGAGCLNANPPCR